MKSLSLCILLFVVSCGSSKLAETGESEPIHAGHIHPANEAAEPAVHPETALEDILPNDGTREVGDVTKCPVSGDVFRVTAASPASDHDGGTYYLCCEGCVDKFAADPAKFLAGDGDAAHHEGHKVQEPESHEHESGHEH